MNLHRKIIVAMATLSLALLTETAHAQLMQCKTFDRSDTRAPQFVREYLEHSKESFVRVCGDDDHPQYSGASGSARDGDVCRYSDYELTLSRTNPPRLERAATPQQTYMLITKSACLPPGSDRYTATNNVQPDVFEHLIGVWRDATSSPEAFDKTLSDTSDVAILQRLRNAISRGSGNRLMVRQIVIDRNFWAWTRYRIDVADPDHSDRFYAVTVVRWLNGTYGISHVSAGIY